MISKHKNLVSIPQQEISSLDIPKFFDVDALVTNFDIEEDNFTLMNAQHIVARIARFEKWTMLLKASPSVLEMAKLLFDNMRKISSEEWEFYIVGC